jgi:thymidylate kinase
MGNKSSLSPSSPASSHPVANPWTRGSDKKGRTRGRRKGGPTVVFVDGIIGAGKSTFVVEATRLLRELGVRCVPVLEPTHVWATLGYPGKLYDNMKENAYAFQVLAVSTRRAALRNAMRENDGTADVYLVDRSPNGDACFERVLHDDGYISTERHCEFIVWKDDWRDVLLASDATIVGILLDTTPDVAMERLSRRETSDAGRVTLEYEKRLYAMHKSMLRGLCGEGCAYFEVPGDTNFKEDRATLMRALTTILPSFLGGLGKAPQSGATPHPSTIDSSCCSSSSSSSASTTPSPSTCPSPRRPFHGIMKSRSHTGCVGMGGDEDSRVTHNPVYAGYSPPTVRRGADDKDEGEDGVGGTMSLCWCVEDEFQGTSLCQGPTVYPTLARSGTLFNIQDALDGVRAADFV